jgi:ribose transport system ATP-binding protein
MNPAAASAQTLLRVSGLVKEYPGVKALGGVDFEVHQGEVHCLLGANGAGKSTLIKCIAGAIAPTQGTISVNGEILPPGNPTFALTQGVATIYQELDLVNDLSVAENIFLGHEPRRFGLMQLAHMRERAQELLERLGHPHISPRTLVRRLRPAEQQIVTISRALSRAVRLLIMDEPSAVLDDNEIDTLFEVVRRLKSQGVGVIYISHRLNEVARIADRVTVMRDGRTVATGLPGDTPAEQLVTHMVGESQALFVTRPANADDAGKPVVLSVQNLTRLPLVAGISFDLRAGEVLGIAGLGGSGRSELLRLIYGMDMPQAGTVRVNGATLPPKRPDLAIAAGLALAPEDRKSQALFLAWDAVKNVTLPTLRRFGAAWLDFKRERDASGEVLQALQTRPHDPARLARHFSGGNQQKIVLARWLLRQCKVLLLDEPTRGIDVGAKAEVFRLIRELVAQDMGVVMVSSEWNELIGFCDRILVMREGRVVAMLNGTTADERTILNYCMQPDARASA